MPDTIIENPILNSPFREPGRHFRFGDEGITNEIVESRRASAYFVPIPPPKKKGKQLQFETQWTQDRIQPNNQVNRIRERVKHWREGEYQGATQVTRKLLQYWTNPDRENKLFFCQYEARYRQWEQSRAGADGAANQTPPVFIVVCNNTNVSKLVFDYIGGWERSWETTRRHSFPASSHCLPTSTMADGRPARSRS